MTDNHTELCERLRTISSCPGWDEAREAAAVIESQAEKIAAYIDQHRRDSAELRRLCTERDDAKTRIQQQALEYVSLFDQCSEHLARIAELEKERDALKVDAQTWRSLLAMLIHEIDKGRRRGPYKGIENAPLHGHAKIGIWDSDNGALSGTQCAWCAVWNEARAALQAEKETRS